MLEYDFLMFVNSLMDVEKMFWVSLADLVITEAVATEKSAKSCKGRSFLSDICFQGQ